MNSLSISISKRGKPPAPDRLAILLHHSALPALADAGFIDYDWEYKAPDSMEGRVVDRRQMSDDEAELVGLLISAMKSDE
jgi:hypothetical protein